LIQNQVMTTMEEDGIKTPRSWLNYWGIMEETILQNKDTIKKNFKSKFKEKMWCHRVRGKKKIKVL
jgi:hypothetical protein